MTTFLIDLATEKSINYFFIKHICAGKKFSCDLKTSNYRNGQHAALHGIITNIDKHLFSDIIKTALEFSRHKDVKHDWKEGLLGHYTSEDITLMAINPLCGIITKDKINTMKEYQKHSILLKDPSPYREGFIPMQNAILDIIESTASHL